MKIVFPKAKEDVLKSLVLSTIQRHSVYCQEGKELKIFTFKKLKSENLKVLV